MINRKRLGFARHVIAHDNPRVAHMSHSHKRRCHVQRLQNHNRSRRAIGRILGMRCQECLIDLSERLCDTRLDGLLGVRIRTSVAAGVPGGLIYSFNVLMQVSGAILRRLASTMPMISVCFIC